MKRFFNTFIFVLLAACDNPANVWENSSSEQAFLNFFERYCISTGADVKKIESKVDKLLQSGLGGKLTQQDMETFPYQNENHNFVMGAGTLNPYNGDQYVFVVSDSLNCHAYTGSDKNESILDEKLATLIDLYAKQMDTEVESFDYKILNKENIVYKKYYLTMPNTLIRSLFVHTKSISGDEYNLLSFQPYVK